MWKTLPIAVVCISCVYAFAQATRSQPLGVGGDQLYQSTAEYMAQHPKCFLPTESLPANYKVSRYRDSNGDDCFDCRVTSVEKDRLHLLGFKVLAKSTVIANDRVAAIFYDLRRKDLGAIERSLRERLGGPTKIEGYSGLDGCKCEAIHWSNDISDIILNQCGDSTPTVSLFYTRRNELVAKP
jgi:hypothetical protein